MQLIDPSRSTSVLMICYIPRERQQCGLAMKLSTDLAHSRGNAPRSNLEDQREYDLIHSLILAKKPNTQAASDENIPQHLAAVRLFGGCIKVLDIIYMLLEVQICIRKLKMLSNQLIQLLPYLPAAVPLANKQSQSMRYHLDGVLHRAPTLTTCPMIIIFLLLVSAPDVA